MSVTLEDFQAVQENVIQIKAENNDLKKQIEAAKKRSQMSGPQIAESLKNDNLQLRVTINQAMKERDQLLEKMKLIKIIQFLQNQNLYEATSMPDIQTMPQKIKPIATEVFSLIEDVKQQIIKRSLLDTQVNELSKKSKSLGRDGEKLQKKISELREKQKSEMTALENSRKELQDLEAETAKLRDSISLATSPKTARLTEEDLKVLQKQTQSLEHEIETRKNEHKKLCEELEQKIAEHDRNIEDATAAKQVIEKKLQQRIWTFQAEINKRKGIVVHAGKNGSRQDSTQLFMESKKLIESIADMQQRNWEMEERVAFTRNSSKMMGKEIVKCMFGKNADIKNNEMHKKSYEMINRIAEIEMFKKNNKE